MSRIWYSQASFTLVSRKTLKREIPSFHRFPEPQSLLGSRIHSASLKAETSVDDNGHLEEKTVFRLSEKETEMKQI